MAKAPTATAPTASAPTPTTASAVANLALGPLTDCVDGQTCKPYAGLRDLTEAYAGCPGDLCQHGAESRGGLCFADSHELYAAGFGAP